MLGFLGASGSAQEGPDLSETGKSALNAPALIPEGEEVLTYFNIMMGPDKVIGFIESSLTRVTRDGQPVYKYHTQTEVHFPTRARLVVDVTADLHPNFEPINIRLERTVTQANGEQTVSLQRATFTKDKVELFGKVGGQEGTMKVVFPERPLVYGIETLVQRLDFKKFPKFRIHEFDMESGGSRPLRVEAKRWGDGTPTVITYNANDTISYQFWFDDEGSLTRWGEATLPTLFARTTRESVEQWKASQEFASGSKGNTPRSPSLQP